MVYCIIMAGGSGSRFWPKSRKNIPKQCLSIFTEKSIFEETIELYSNLVDRKEFYIATGNHLYNHLKKIVPDVNYVLEPMAKNTAACIGLAAVSILKKSRPDDIIIIDTSDHIYRDPENYFKHVEVGIKAAEQGNIVQFGIKPTRIEIGFGYIEIGEEVIVEDEVHVHNVVSFKEKPNFKVAKEYVNSGRFLWNSGIFISRIDVLLDEFKIFMPELYDGLMKIKESGFDKKIITEVFESLESVPIDVGVIEKTSKNLVIIGEFPWDDIGDWSAIDRAMPRDINKNVIKSASGFEGVAKNCIIFSDIRKVICEFVEELIIVDTEDATLICDKSRAQDVKKVVDLLMNADLAEYTIDFVKDHTSNNIVIDSDNCEVKSDGLTALIGVNNLDIKRNKKELIIKGQVEFNDS